jgi:hypothetical protein
VTHGAVHSESQRVNQKLQIVMRPGNVSSLYFHPPFSFICFSLCAVWSVDYNCQCGHENETLQKVIQTCGARDTWEMIEQEKGREGDNCTEQAQNRIQWPTLTLEVLNRWVLIPWSLSIG